MTRLFDDRCGARLGAQRQGHVQPTWSRRALAGGIVLAVAWVCLALASPAQAEGADPRLGLELRSTVSGDVQPAIVIQPSEALRQLTVELTRSDGQTRKLTSGAVGMGQRKELVVDQPVGKFSYQAQFTASWAVGEPSSFGLAFDFVRVGKLELTVDPKDVDLDARKMIFRLSNPAQSAELTIVGMDQQPMDVVRKDYAGAAGGSPLELQWGRPKADMLYMDLKVTDVAGFWKVVRLTPFSISIPHDDVKFDNDKSDIKPSEEPKLEHSLTLIKEALDKHGKLLQVKLFVAGYTDTVSSRDHNQTLSEARARSIAAWFRRKGLKVPIFYQGFGEDALAKPTPDETPEPANRRALYLLASQRPATSAHLPRDAWKEL